jgi:homoserine trans-succinylase
VSEYQLGGVPLPLPLINNLEINNIFKDKVEEEGASVTNIRILEVLIIRLLGRKLNRLIKEIELVELWDKG